MGIGELGKGLEMLRANCENCPFECLREDGTKCDVLEKIEGLGSR